LGNPGPQYAETRHNIGFMVLDELARRWGPVRKKTRVKFGGRWFNRFPGAIQSVRGPDGVKNPVFLLWPLTYMNRSGHAVSRATGTLDTEPQRIVVIHDDVDLALGRIKVKRGGGTGGHKGLDSIVAALDTRAFARVRCGVGRPMGGVEVTDHVLSPFDHAEQSTLEEMLDTAGHAAEMILTEGPVAAMNRFNRS
jgi:PTH1 family peptidyl-tRNA hydrolase